MLPFARSAVLFACAAASTASCRREPPPESAARSGPASAESTAPPLYDNLGAHHHAITANATAQRYFDQGLRLTYAFNHEEAINSFREGARRDPNCAMCWWGVALALGPNINIPMDTAAVAPALDAVRRARVAASRTTPRERDYIAALAKRYNYSQGTNRARLDSAYANAMRTLAHRYPDDLDAQTLYAEALMDLQPWDYYTVGGAAKGGILEITHVLEGVISRDPNHPGACHYYIHAVEASHLPERALPCAERLAGLMPGAGHLVHMPAHVYVRVGRYADAAEHNEHALHADQQLIERRNFSGPYPHVYVTHNWHFLWFARTMQGEYEPALAAARKVTASVPLEAVRAFPPLEVFPPTVYFAMARFGRWDDLLKQPAPPAELRYTTAIWHYTRGLALVAKGRRAEAKAERHALAAIAAALPADFMVNINAGKSILGIADRHLGAELAVAERRRADAVRLLREAASIEDSLTYDEPPAWYWPMREVLGQVLLDGGDAKGAEAAFREDLTRNRENGWALTGLAASLRAQGKVEEADQVEQRLKQAWPRAAAGPV